MSTLVLDYRGADLRVDNGALAVHCVDGQIIRAPLAQLDRVILACDARLAVSAIRQLAAARVPLHVLRGRSRADASLLWPSAGDAVRRLAQRRAFDTPDDALRLARLLVRHRITGQMRLLDAARGELPRLRYPLSRGLRLLRPIRSATATATSIDRLRGLEGAAAALYFVAYGRLFPRALGFAGRRRRPPTDPVNACLSLGFSLLHARLLEEAHLAALDAGLGVLHRPSHNRASLACDLVELERAAIEEAVWRLFRSEQLRRSDFDHGGYGVTLAKSGRGVFFGTMEPILTAAARRTRRRLNRLVRWLIEQHAMPAECEDNAP